MEPKKRRRRPKYTLMILSDTMEEEGVKQIYIGSVYPDIIHMDVDFRKALKNQPKQFVLFVISFYYQQRLTSTPCLPYIIIHIFQTPR